MAPSSREPWTHDEAYVNIYREQMQETDFRTLHSSPPSTRLVHGVAVPISTPTRPVTPWTGKSQVRVPDPKDVGDFQRDPTATFRNDLMTSYDSWWASLNGSLAA